SRQPSCTSSSRWSRCEFLVRSKPMFGADSRSSARGTHGFLLASPIPAADHQGNRLDARAPGDLTRVRLPSRHPGPPRASDRTALAQVVGSGLLHRHSRHTAPRPALAALLRARLLLSANPVDQTKLPVAGFARRIFLCGASLHLELRRL